METFSVRSRVTRLSEFLLVILLLLAPLRTAGEEVTIPPSQGFVSDFAGVIDQSTHQQLTNLIRELQEKTSAEIAVVTVETTQPLTVFDYALKIAETWKPGAKGKDNGVVFLVATKDRKVRIATGYGVEGILPDGKIGAIQDADIVPYFKQGNYSQGILAGTQALAREIAKEHGVSLTGLPSPRGRSHDAEPVNLPTLLIILFIILAIFSTLSRSGWSPYSRYGHRRGRYGGGYGGGGFGGGGFGGSGGGFGGFGGGGRDFDGFGGGSFGGGGAERDW
jgi:uncharacterized protein